MSNRHPVDELADVREAMKVLKTREAELRAAILTHECGLTGDEYEATIKETETERVDTKELKKEFGLEKLRPFLKPVRAVTVWVKAREMMEDVG